MPRLIRFILIVMLTSAFQLGWAQQSHADEPLTTQHDLSKIVHLFPNPAFDFVYIKITEFPAEKVKLTLHNILGNEMDIEAEIMDDHQLRVKVKDLASGYYLLAVREEESKFRGTFKFVKR